MPGPQVPLVLYGGVVALLGLIIVKCYQTLKSPLYKLPGPTSSKWTRLRLKYEILRGNRVYYVDELHKGYGPIVRLGPDEVSLSDTDSTKTIYRVGSPYLKTDFYKAFTGAGPYGSLFILRDKDVHNHHRKLQSHHFSEKWIKGMEPFIIANVQRAIGRMREDVERKGWTDVFQWFTFMATDVIGEASFGDSFRMLETGRKNQYSHDLEMIASRGTFRSEFPGVVKLLAYIPTGPGKQIGRAVMRMNEYASQSLERYERQRNADPENVKPTLLTKLYDGVDNGTYAREQLETDARGNIIAGTDTTAVSATYAVWLLAKHPRIEYELIRAVSTLPSDFTDEDLREIKLLNNIIQETLRLRGAVGSMLPRKVPAGGAEFCGYHIPEGTAVGMQAWTMHRKPEVWHDPDAFEPSRWDNPTKEMKDCFFAFGGGSRVCIGMHLAQLELRHSLANFYRAFEAGVMPAAVEGFTEDDMKPQSLFLMPPRGKRCLLAPRKSTV